MSEPKTLVGIEARLLETLFADDQPRVRLSARETQDKGEKADAD